MFAKNEVAAAEFDNGNEPINQSNNQIKCTKG